MSEQEYWAIKNKGNEAFGSFYVIKTLSHDEHETYKKMAKEYRPILGWDEGPRWFPTKEELIAMGCKAVKVKIVEVEE
jgi:hypothetical protein